MLRTPVDDGQKREEEQKELKIQENITNWQSGSNPLAALTEEQTDLVYQMKDLLDEHYNQLAKESSKNVHENVAGIPVINSNQDYIKWMVTAENEMKLEQLNDYFVFYDKLKDQTVECEALFKNAESTLQDVEQLREEYQEVTSKTDSLHNLSEQLMKYQKQLKEKKAGIKERLRYFRMFNPLSDIINQLSVNVTSDAFMESLDKIDECMEYLNNNLNYKEAPVYLVKYEGLLSKAVILIRRYFNDVIVNVTKQVTDPDSKPHLLPDGSPDLATGESSFSLYYGKFQSASLKIKPIITRIELKINKHSCYKQLVSDCQQIYFAERSPVIADIVTKSLAELRNKHKNNHSILFRSAGLFILQVCQDEAACFKYFFVEQSYQLNEYFGILCQSLYDMLRPSLLGIYHLEVLTELCAIYRREMLNDQIQSNAILDKFAEIVRQLLQDIEERLVFRTHIFLQNNVLQYKPAPGDLAYPEKLEQMENIAEEIIDYRAESRSSIVSIESQEVANINTGHLGPFRSYTGNSPADLHGMWYPTVKRTLVCLSRLYFCLDREIFQGLAQEGLTICIETISKAQLQIASKKSEIDGRLFEIKHLLILREQIAPFQVDFTIKEVSLDFSSIKSAAYGLIQNRDKLFTFNSNNALLEFLLEGTPKVKEYLVDSRKDIDKQLKSACEAFIANTTTILVGNIQQWIQKAQSCLKPVKTAPGNPPSLRELEIGKPQVLGGIISAAQRNIKTKIPDIQRYMQLYLANKETEFILFRPVKNAIINTFIQVEQILEAAHYTNEEYLVIGCPMPEQVNILICSVSLTAEQDHYGSSSSRASSVSSFPHHVQKDKLPEAFKQNDPVDPGDCN